MNFFQGNIEILASNIVRVLCLDLRVALVRIAS